MGVKVEFSTFHKVREDLGLTIAQCAKILGISRSSIYFYDRLDKLTPKAKAAIKGIEIWHNLKKKQDRTKCGDCNKDLTDKVAKFSLTRFKKLLCYSCQRKGGYVSSSKFGTWKA